MLYQLTYDADELSGLFYDGPAPGEDDIGDLHDIDPDEDAPAWDVPW